MPDALRKRWHGDTLRREKAAEVFFDVVKYPLTAVVVGSWSEMSGVALPTLLVWLADCSGIVLVAVGLLVNPSGSRQGRS